MNPLKSSALVLALAVGGAKAELSLAPYTNPIITLTKYQIKSGNAQDRQHALALLQPLAEAGNARAQTGLGLLYAKGWAVPRDYEKARQWWERAAAGGDPHLQFNLALLYLHVAALRDEAQARHWLERAAAGDDEAIRAQTRAELRALNG